MSKPSILCGLIGAGIQASLTPAMHEREGAEQCLLYIYKNLDLEPLGLDRRRCPICWWPPSAWGSRG